VSCAVAQIPPAPSAGETAERELEAMRRALACGVDLSDAPKPLPRSPAELHRWLRNHVALEWMDGRIQPPAKVLAERKADCKGYATLAAAMGHALGFPAAGFAVLGRRDVDCFEHVVPVWDKANGSKLFIDAQASTPGALAPHAGALCQGLYMPLKRSNYSKSGLGGRQLFDSREVLVREHHRRAPGAAAATRGVRGFTHTSAMRSGRPRLGMGALTDQQNAAAGQLVNMGANALVPGSGQLLPIIGPLIGGDIGKLFGGGGPKDGGLEKLTADQLVQAFENPSLIANVGGEPKQQFDRIRAYIVGPSVPAPNYALPTATKAQAEDHTRRSAAEYGKLSSAWLKNASTMTRIADQARLDQLAGKVTSYNPFGYMRAALGMAPGGAQPSGGASIAPLPGSVPITNFGPGSISPPAPGQSVTVAPGLIPELPQGGTLTNWNGTVTAAPVRKEGLPVWAWIFIGTAVVGTAVFFTVKLSKRK